MQEKELKRLKDLTIEADGLEERILQLYARAQQTTALLDGLPRSSTMRSKIEETIIKLRSVIEEQERKLTELYILREQFETELDARDLTRRQKDVLRYRYLKSKSYGWIAKELNQSVSHIFKVHRLALKRFLDRSE